MDSVRLWAEKSILRVFGVFVIDSTVASITQGQFVVNCVLKRRSSKEVGAMRESAVTLPTPKRWNLSVSSESLILSLTNSFPVRPEPVEGCVHGSTSSPRMETLLRHYRITEVRYLIMTRDKCVQIVKAEMSNHLQLVC